MAVRSGMWDTVRMDLSKFRHPAWGVFVLPLALAIGSTFTPGQIRAWLLIAAVIAAVLTFHKTEYAGQSLKKTVPVGIGFLVLALIVFFIGRAMDTPVKAIQVASQQTPVAPPPPAPALPQ